MRHCNDGNQTESQVRRHLIAVGDRFGRLTVVGFEIRHASGFARYAICNCDCGQKDKAIRVDGLYRGAVVSCGCFLREQFIQRTRGIKRNIPSGAASVLWKGGRVVNYHGYVLVKVGRNHPWADKQGYILEHRLIVGQVLGRKLEPHEPVHHKDHNKTNNALENLEYCSSPAWHGVHHRKRSDLRHPNEPNPIIECACGCGETFEKYDSIHRPRRYLPNHRQSVRRRD